MSYDAGDAALRIFPSMQGFATAVDREVTKVADRSGRAFAKIFSERVRAGMRGLPLGPSASDSARQGEQSGGAFANGFKARVAAALRALPVIKLNADSSEADVKIAAIRAQLQTLHGQRIGIDIDEGLALAQIAHLMAELEALGASSPSVQVQTDSARAAAELAAVQAQVDLLDGRNVNINVTDNGSAARTLGGLSGLAAGIAALGPGLVPLGGAGIAGVGGIGALAAASAGGLGVLALGLAGVSKAVKGVDQANAAAAKTSRSAAGAEGALANARANAASGAIRAAEAVRNARRSVEDAERNAATALRQALRQQTLSERDLATAQLAAKQAQLDLTAARKSAAEQIEDLTLRVQDGALAQRQALLDQADAKRFLDLVLSNPNATEKQRAEAQLAYDQATQQITDLGVQQRRLVEQQAAAAKAGVEGSKQVVDAQRNIVESQQRVTDARTASADAAAAVTEAQRAGAEQVLKAQEALTSALRAQSDQQRQSAFAIAQAQRSAAGGAGASATNPYKGMTADGIAFVNFIRTKLRPALAGIRGEAQGGLLPGLQAGLTRLLPLLPLLGVFVGHLATDLGNLFDEASKALTSPFWLQFFAFVDRTAGPMLTTFGRVLGNLAKGFAGLAIAFQPVVDQIGAGVLRLTQRFAKFGEGAGSNGFQRFVGYAQKTLPLVSSFFGSLFRAVAHLSVALAPFGAVALKAVKGLADGIRKIPVPILRLLLAVVLPLTVAIYALNKAEAIGNATKNAYTVATKIATTAKKLFTASTVADTAAQNTSTLSRIRGIGALVAQKVAMVATTVATKAMAAGQWLLNAALTANPIGLVVVAIAALVAGLVLAWRHSETFRNVVTGAFNAVRGAFSSLLGAAQNVFGWLRNNWKTVATILTGPIGIAVVLIVKNFDKIVGFAKSLPGRVTAAAKGMWDGLTTGLKVAINGIIGLWNRIDFRISIKLPDKLGGFGWTSPDLFPDLPTFASGGGVRGPGTKTSDSIPALLSNGEHVWTADEVQGAGGHAVVEMLRGLFRGYATGGAVTPSLASGGMMGMALLAALSRQGGRVDDGVLAGLQQRGTSGSGGPLVAATIYGHDTFIAESLEATGRELAFKLDTDR